MSDDDFDFDNSSLFGSSLFGSSERGRGSFRNVSRSAGFRMTDQDKEDKEDMEGMASDLADTMGKVAPKMFESAAKIKIFGLPMWAWMLIGAGASIAFISLIVWVILKVAGVW